MPGIPFVDRASELSFLRDRFAHACDQGPGLVLLSAPAGAGKTALIRHFFASLASQALVADGRGWDNRGASSLHALREVVGQLPCRSDELDPAVRLLTGNPAGDAAAHLSLDHLFPTLATFLHDLASRQPLCLSLDDLQWIDEATFEWLDFTFRQRTEARILWIGAYRSEETGSLESLLRRRAVWHRTGRFAELALGPLSRPAVDELTGLCLPNCEQGTAEEIWQRSEGLALLAVEEIRARREGKQDAPAGEALIADRLNRLTGRQREVLSMGAVIGERFDVDPLAAALEQDPQDLVRQLEALRVSQGLLEEDGEGYRFAHGRYREALLSAMSQAMQRLYHTRLADQEVAMAPADHTYHLVQSGNVEQGVQALLAEGDQTRVLSDWRDALRYYMEALWLVQSRPESDRHLYLAVFQSIGDIHLIAGGKHLLARSYYEAARTWATDPTDRALLLCRLARTYRADSLTRLQLLEEAVQQLPLFEDPQVETWVRFLRATSPLSAKPGDQPSIRELAGEIRPISHLPHEWFGSVIPHLLRSTDTMDDVREFERQVERIKTLWPEAVHHYSFHVDLATAYRDRWHDREAARRHLRQARQLNEGRGSIAALTENFAHEVRVELEIGAYENVRALAGDFLLDVEQPDPRWRVYLHLCQTWPYDHTPEGLTWAERYLEGIAAFFLEFPTDEGHLRSLLTELGIVERIFRELGREGDFRERIDDLRERLQAAGYQTDAFWYVTDPVDRPELESADSLEEWQFVEQGGTILKDEEALVLRAPALSGPVTARPRVSRTVFGDFTLQATVHPGSRVREDMAASRRQLAAGQRFPLAFGSSGLCAIRDPHHVVAVSAHDAEPDEALFHVHIEGQRPNGGRGLLKHGPIRLRLERRGTAFHAYAGNEGGDWFQVGRAELPGCDHVEVAAYGCKLPRELPHTSVDELGTRLWGIRFVQSGPRPVVIEPTDSPYELPDPIYAPHLPGVVAASPGMQKAMDQVRRMGSSSLPVFIQGETGTGKELVARAVHQLGDRSGSPFIPVNCAAFLPELLDSELFGHVRGAYTGAYESRGGLFEAADGGILFLDEIGDAAPAFQARLLRAIEEQAIRRIGAQQLRPIDVRVVAATNQDLRQAMAAGLFRRDFYYRLAGVEIHLPPLRERRDDIPHLIAHTLQNWARRRARDYPTITQHAAQLLFDSDWPGNVRELIHAVEAAAEEAGGEPIAPFHLSLHAVSVRPSPPLPDQDERQRIMAILRGTNGNVSAAARRLGIHRNTLHRRMRRLGIR